MLLSVIVPIYNTEKYLQQCIESILCQKVSEMELILVDDCSTDDGREKIEQYIKERTATLGNGACQPIRLIVKKENEGAAKARNTGIEAAQGRYIAFLDADDVWMADKLSKQMEFIERTQAAFAFAAYEFGDENAKGTGKVVYVPDTLSYQKALSRTVIFTSTVVLDRQKIKKELLSMPDVKSEDTAFWWKLLKNGLTAYGLNEVLVIYRRPAKSLSSNKWEAIKRIWYLYRKQEKLPLIVSMYYFIFWAVRATLRRL